MACVTKNRRKNRTSCHKSTLSGDEYSEGAFLEEVVIGATSAADPLSCIVERRISNEAKTIPNLPMTWQAMSRARPMPRAL